MTNHKLRNPLVAVLFCTWAWDRSSHNLFVCIHLVSVRREGKDEKENASCKVEANKQSIFGKLLPYGPDFNWLTYYNVHKNCYLTRDWKKIGKILMKLTKFHVLLQLVFPHFFTRLRQWCHVFSFYIHLIHLYCYVLMCVDVDLFTLEFGR